MNFKLKRKQNYELIKNIKSKNLLIVCKKINESLDKNEEIDENVINMLFINLLEENKMNEILIIYNNILKSKFKVNDKLKTILIRIYSDINIKKSLEILNSVKNIKRRMLIPILNSYSKNNDMNIINFYKDNFYNKFILTLDEFNAILKVLINTKNFKEVEFILRNMSENITKIDSKMIEMLKLYFKNYNFKIIEYENKCCNCNNTLKSININSLERGKLIDNLINNYINKKEHEKLKKFKIFLLKKKNIDIFLDACNILFFADRKINFKSYKRLDSIVNTLLKKNFKILIIIHKRHFDYLDQTSMSKKEKKLVKNMFDKWKNIIYYTPYKMNDDWFFLYGTFILDNSKLVTNDKMRDHIFKISEKTLIDNTLSKWIDRSVINYEFKNNSFNIDSLILIFPNSYSKRIQKVNDIWHFPIDNKYWFCQGTKNTLFKGNKI